jgi:hypothetical protein
MSDCCDLFCRAETPVRQQSALHDDEKDVVHKDHQGNVIKVVKAIKPHPVLVESASSLSLLYGLFLVLFGSQFPTTILVWETFLLVGYDKTAEAYNKIKDDVLVTILTLKDLEANSKETVDKAMNAYNKKDFSSLSIDDGKHLLGVLSKVDYKHAAEALKTLQITAMVIVGCLKVQVVKAASLGGSIGDTVSSTVHYYIDMILKPFINPMYWKIISPSITAFTYSVSIYLAVFCGTMMQTYQSALKGSSLVSKSAYDLVANKLKFLPKKYAKTICDVIGVGLVIYALEFQAMNTLGANAGINMMLTPVTIVENYLTSLNNV